MGVILLSFISLTDCCGTFFSQVKSLYAKGTMMSIRRLGIEKLKK